MFDNIMVFFKKVIRKEQKLNSSKDAAKERLHLVLMQDRANVSADFLELMKQEIIEVIKKYIDVDETAMDVRLTNKTGEDGQNGAPALYANIPILHIKSEEGNVNILDETKLKEKNKEDKKENNEEAVNLEKKSEEIKKELSQEENKENSEKENNLIDNSQVNSEKKSEKKEEKSKETKTNNKSKNKNTAKEIKSK